MISFGELRKKSVEWQMEISAVEKIYARDWLLYGFFQNDVLREQLVLRGASALASAYFAPNAESVWNYPRVDDIDFARDALREETALESEMENAVSDAARASGLQFRLHSFHSSEARVEFTGPLGRRSAAQPLLVARLFSLTPRSEIAERGLVHPFSDECQVAVRAISLSELAAERIVLYSQKPRARDVFDLWFILTRGADGFDLQKTRALAETLGAAKRISLRAELDSAYAPILERGWENSLKEIRPRPPFAQARSEIEKALAILFE